MDIFDENADELRFPIPKKMSTNEELFRSYRNQQAIMLVQFENKLLNDLSKRDHDKLISEIELLKKTNEELLKENGALQFQVQNLSAEIDELKQRRVKAPNKNKEIWRHIVDGEPSKDITRSECVYCKTHYVHDHQPHKIDRHIMTKSCMKSRLLASLEENVQSYV